MYCVQAVYFLEIFANKIDDSNKLGDDVSVMTSFRLKCACKFKIICDKLAGKMHPLPNCASGEWGPSKAQRHFGLTPISHKSSVVNVDNDVLVVLRLSRPLKFHCKLKMNGFDDAQLADSVTYEVTSEMLLRIKVAPPQIGQYGLDIFARPEDSSMDTRTLAHACKYLLNVTRVKQPRNVAPAAAAVTGATPSQPPPSQQLPVSAASKDSPRSSTSLPAQNSPRGSSSAADMPPPSQRQSTAAAATRRDLAGPSQHLPNFGIKTVDPVEPNVEVVQGKEFTSELKFPEPLKVIAELVRAASGEKVTTAKVTVKEESKKAKVVIKSPEAGAFVLNIYARLKKDEVAQALLIYTYFVTVITEEEAKANKKKNKGKTS